MANKITELPAELAGQITEAWVTSYPNQVDSVRNLDVLRFHLFQDTGTHWYHGVVDGAFFMVTNIVPGHQAVVHTISTSGAGAFPDPESVLPVMRDIMDEHKLIKLVMAVPGHARKLYESVKKVKFELEGWLKLGCLIDGQPTDLAMMGLFREDIDVLLAGGVAPKVKRAPKRKKKKKGTNGQADSNKGEKRQED
jgi:hypothetical protein